METGGDYTSFKLTHANAQHLHDTSTTKFVGPIPQGWFVTHKGSWLKPRTNYHRNERSFSIDGLDSENAQILAACPRWLAEGAIIEDSVEIRDDSADASTPGSSTKVFHGTSQDGISPRHRTISTQSAETGSKPASVNSTETITPQADSRMLSLRLLDSTKTTNDAMIIQENNLMLSTTNSDWNMTKRDLNPPTSESNRAVSGISTPNGSAMDSLSFTTAPETMEEQAALARELDFQTQMDIACDDTEVPFVEAGQEDETSDTSTIRYSRRENPRADHVSVGEQYSPNAQSFTGIVNDIDPPSQRTASSSDATSRKSLMHQRDRERSQSIDIDIAHRANPPLVHFDEHEPEFSNTHQPKRRSTVCSEALEMDQKTAALIARRRRGYFNQKLLRNPFRKTLEPGELLRAERMLLRVEYAQEGAVPSDYSDIKAGKVERRTDMHWREFILAARENEEGLLVFNFHRNRTIPAIAKQMSKTKATVQIVLDPNQTKANLYSPLDKTIVIWQKSKKERKGTLIYILRPSTTHSSIQWYALIQTRLNMKPRAVAVINVPDLNIKLRLKLTTERGDNSASDLISLTSEDDSSHSVATDDQSIEFDDSGHIVAAGVVITDEYLIQTCWKLLANSAEWKPVLSEWKKREKLGLCWRRYDRLEWIHGSNAKQLIGQWAMQATHELEFRPKVHYATHVKLPSGGIISEPYPVEGFLVRLTSSTGRQARFGKVFYKRLYFSTHDGLLFFSTPAKAAPPPPPSFRADSLHEVEEHQHERPLVYDVEPYPLDDSGRITWLRPGISPEAMASRDAIAFTEKNRRVAQLQVSDGYIDLTQVISIRKCKRSKEDRDNHISYDTSEIPFHATGNDEGDILVDNEEGFTDEFDDGRVFELVLDSGLVIRLQAYNKETRRVWMEQLADLVKYWKRRYRADSAQQLKLRRSNIDILQIDEEVESLVGQFANKWEVSQCVSDPQIYNFCPISACRTIALRGLLYRKPRVHSTFRQYECLVSHGQMLVFNHTHSDAAGVLTHHIHHSKREVLELKDCYIYSGSVCTGDLIGPRESSARDGPGRRSLPRLYTDGWTSQDEQEALCFVIWTGRRRTAFSGADKDDSDKRSNSVSRLGVTGRSMIYMARCRQERDLWVQMLGNEIEKTTSGGQTA